MEYFENKFLIIREYSHNTIREWCISGQRKQRNVLHRQWIFNLQEHQQIIIIIIRKLNSAGDSVYLEQSSTWTWIDGYG